MKQAIVIATVLAFNASQVLANCPSGGNLGDSGQQTIQNVLGGNYACVYNPTLQNNEQHTGSATDTTGFVLDYKKGPGDPADPSDTLSHPTGSYSISGNLITYTYGSLTYSYNINATPSGNVYTFCHVAPGGSDLAVTISLSPCS